MQAWAADSFAILPQVSLAGLGFGAESPRAAIVGSHPGHEIATWILFPSLIGRRRQLLMPAGLLAAAWASFLLPLHPSTPALLEPGTQEPVGLVPALPSLGKSLRPSFV